MSEDWAAVAGVIAVRLRELGWRQRELAERSQVSQAIIRELQYHTVERRRSARTLEALSIALELHPDHLNAVLNGQTPLSVGAPATEEERMRAQLNVLELRLDEVLSRLADVQGQLRALVRHTAEDDRAR
ncbi:helix-turn-helix domain-containing protein [Actinokineospora globicatena]|uniref:Uncharacterized protein n=1 Tax=Actinokineospora globicatena TaxID=103729 RepID=A0A9W6QMC2_9PSEU|nr:helix-turn-helix transcriptional regulator [Actinokineospora globicatena]GLW92325.1 hypothetical protein Aglo03_31410 [Actinokineospora globicatena]